MLYYINVSERERTTNMLLFGQKIINTQTNEIGLLIKTWQNRYADKTVDFATCVDKNGKKYEIELDLITPMED